MKICDKHRDTIRATMWAQGIPPSQDGAEAAGRGRLGGDPYTMVQALILANTAKNFPASALAAPAESCPCCENKAIADWIPEAILAIKHECGL